MNIVAIRQKAAALGIVAEKMSSLSKPELIRTIQIAEGYTACFGSRTGGCPYTQCCWMADCYAEASRRTGKGRSVRAT